MNEVTVYQVRSVDAYGKQNVVHAYETEEEAQNALTMMKGRTGKRYVIVPVANQPDQHWGINFPPEPQKPVKSRRR